MGLCTMIGCGPSKAEIEAQRRADSIRIADRLRIVDSIRTADSLRRADSIRIADSTAHAKKVIQFISDMYNQHKFEDYSFLHKHCTPKMIKYLEENYDYDCETGDCLAVWMFRSDAQDGNSENGIISVTPKGDDWYHYKFNDGGTKGAHDIKVIDQNGKLMIDGLKRFQSTK
jgi:hypothetical protein